MARVKVIKRDYGNGSIEYYPNLYIDEKSKIYWWRETIDGSRFFKSTGQKTIGKALTEIKRLRREATKDKRALFEDAFNLALEIKETKSAKTFEEAKSQDKRLRPWFTKNCKYIEKFDKNYEELWVKYSKYAKELNLEKRGVEGSLWHDRKHLVYVLNRATVKGWVRRYYKASMFSLDYYQTDSGRELTQQELRIIFSECIRIGDETLYDQCLIALLTGMRKSEILGLRVSEVCLRKNQINPEAGRIKTRIERKVPIEIPEPLRLIFKKLIKRAKENDGDCLFPLANKDHTLDFTRPQQDINKKNWKEVRKKLNDHCIFKDFRATCITNLVKDRIPPTTIAKMLGNSGRMIEKVYDKIHGDLRQEVRVALNNCFSSLKNWETPAKFKN